MSQQVLVVDPTERPDILKALASEVRARLLEHLTRNGPRNVNQLADELGLPQSTVSSNVQVLVDAGLISTRSEKGRKGSQKICQSTFTELLVAFKDRAPSDGRDCVEVAMPIGLYTRCEVSAPCGLCSPDGVIGLLDVPDTFLEPDRMRAGLLWFTRGFVEYQFPNNAKLAGAAVAALDLSMELSSEVPGTSKDWPSDITVAVNGHEIDTWTSPGDFGDRRGRLTPEWWKLAGSQYGEMRTWTVSKDGTARDGTRVSDCDIGRLALDEHRSIRVRIGVRDGAAHPGGLNLFGRGFGDHGRDLTMRLTLA